MTLLVCHALVRFELPTLESVVALGQCVCDALVAIDAGLAFLLPGLHLLSQLWQLRHSCESLAIIAAHTCSASSARLASNFSGVSMLPRRWWYSSLDAWILRHTFGPHSLGTWQSEQIARTPEALR